MTLTQIAQNAKKASIQLASLSTDTKNKALIAIADALEANKARIIEANQKDLQEAKTMLENREISESIYNRLKLDDNKIRDMIQGIRDVKNLEDPVNKIMWTKELAKDLILKKVTCPIGVIGVIFEARPDVIAQISSLAIKSSNSVILKGGREAHNTNIVIADVINNTLNNIENFPKNTINLIFTREDVSEMLKLDDYIDLIIPRGSNSLVKFIQSNTKIPVLGHADGICHIYIDETADINKVLPVIIDSKCQYPSACNSVETILINDNALMEFIEPIVDILSNNGVEIRADECILEVMPELNQATQEDWVTEYGDKIVSIKTVQNIDEAINHINTYGSHHTDCIITENAVNKEYFMSLVDSAGVYANVSTRFADGFRYGFGAEVGISTNKTHARGPVGLDGLTIYKYKLYGNGDIVADFANSERQFTHKYL